jgi:hypothetical protein
MQMQQSNPIPSFGPVFWVCWLVAIVFFIWVMWRIFEKAGKPGWAAIIPIYNSIVKLQIAGKPVWWFFLYFIPLVNIVIAIIVTVAFARVFGKGGWFAVGLIFLGVIFYPILAFGDAQYQPPPPSM